VSEEFFPGGAIMDFPEEGYLKVFFSGMQQK